MSDSNVSPPKYREVTLTAIIFAIIIGIVMNAAITYAGLKIGFTLGGSAIAAVLGFGVLRGVLRKGSILETNIAQTVASAINTSNSGVIFTVPVLLLIGYKLTIDSADFWLITLACVGGAFLGTAFIIPLRKQMLDIERLRFPTATAVASILKSPGAGSAKAVVLLIGLAIGALIYFPTQFATLFGESAGLSQIPGIGAANGGFLGDDSVNVGSLFGLPAQIEVIFAIAPFALGAGYLTGRAGLYVLAGGVISYWILNPVAFSMGWTPEHLPAADVPSYGFQAFNRPLGIGLLLGGAMMGILFALPAIKEAIKSIGAASKIAGGGGADELGLKTLGAAAIAALIFLFLAAAVVGNKPVNLDDPITGTTIEDVVASETYEGYTIGFESEETAATWVDWTDEQRLDYLDTLNAKRGLLASIPPLVRAGIIAVIGALWIWFAGIIIAQCTGMTDWSPISGMALLTVVLVLLLAGSGAVVGAVLIGAALCVAITLAADMMADMKTGYLVGAIPKRQQKVELAFVSIGPLVCMLTVLLIASANTQQYGVPMGPETPTGAPQAQALQAVITGVQGGEMPYALYGFGALLGGLLGLGSFSGLGVLIGLSMYLPFIYISTYGIGCIAQMIVAKVKGKNWAEDWGVPFCAGLIVGESLLALSFSLWQIIPRGGDEEATDETQAHVAPAPDQVAWIELDFQDTPLTVVMSS
ncbi:MAG: OPT/YSL family transporter [Planctomycetota bacterium]